MTIYSATMMTGSRDTLEVKPLPKSGRSPSRSPNSKNRKKQSQGSSSYASDGVTNNNIFSLPTTDYRALAFLTLVAAVVRLFRIYQPSSVVFDEVQYVLLWCYHGLYIIALLLIPLETASVALRPNTSREGSLWMFTPRLPNSS